MFLYFCNNLKFCMRIYIYKYNRNIQGSSQMVHISWSTDFGRDDFARLIFLYTYNSVLYYVQVYLCEPSYLTSARTLDKVPSFSGR